MTIDCNTTIPAHSPVFVDTHFALASFYWLFMLCTATILLVRRRRGHITARWQYVFYTLIIKGCLLRGLWAMLQPFFLSGDLALPNRVNFTLNILPSFVFFGNYIILLSLWGVTFHGSRLGSSASTAPISSGAAGAEVSRPYVHKAAWIVYISIVVVYLILVSLDFAMHSESGRWCPVSTAINAVETGITLYDAFVYLIASILFAFYGIGLQCRMLRNPGNSRRRKWVLFRINSLTSLAVIAFTVRSTLVVVGNFYNLSGFSSGYIDILYYTCLELVPLAFMLIVLISGSAPQTTRYHSMNTPPK